jgi:nucleotidyltransferase substrate binding protein (TIGR01987 family)
VSLKTIHTSVKGVEEANSKLKESLLLFHNKEFSGSKHEVICDAVIKRFEIAFEYCWKLLKAAAEYQGVEANGPRPAIQEAVRFGWIKEPEFWAEALDARNGSVHDYFGISRNQYMKLIKRFSDEIDLIIAEIKKLR